MNALLAHLILIGRHHKEVWIGGYRWKYCGHRSHWRRIRCRRWFHHDGYCGRHNESCWGGCPLED